MMFQVILDWEPLPYAVAGLAALATVPVVLRIKRGMDRKKRRDAYPADTVILHQIGRAPAAPSMSQFAMKLETYLRFAKIPYQNEHDLMDPSSKGKTPWMTYNGEDVADSQVCIDYLNEKLDIDLNSHLSQQENAIARAFLKLTEDSLYWCTMLHRWLYDKSGYTAKPGRFATRLPAFAIDKLLGGPIRAATKGHGMGRHSYEQVLNICYQDLQALSDFIGKKEFLMGDQPCEVDCSVFGCLTQLAWQMPTSPAQEDWMKGEFRNLTEYCDRMKEMFWPDWDDCVTHGMCKA